MADLADMLEGLLQGVNGKLSVELAQHLLQMRFTDVQAARHHELAEKSQLGTLTHAEREELDALVTANTVLMILKSQARRSLVGQPSAA